MLSTYATAQAQGSMDAQVEFVEPEIGEELEAQAMVENNFEQQISAELRVEYLVDGQMEHSDVIEPVSLEQGESWEDTIEVEAELEDDADNFFDLRINTAEGETINRENYMIDTSEDDWETELQETGEEEEEHQTTGEDETEENDTEQNGENGEETGEEIDTSDNETEENGEEDTDEAETQGVLDSVFETFTGILQF